MTGKAEFLATITQALGDLKPGEKPTLPPPPEVWPVRGLSAARMKEQFAVSLTAAAGECVLLDRPDEIPQRIADLLRAVDARRIGIHGTSAARSLIDPITAAYPIERFQPAAEIDPQEVARLDAAIMTPEFLLADSGSCLFAAPTVLDRLLVYLPPLCIVAADTAMLREHLPHAWADFSRRWGEGRTGEFAIVTGPSRTADIEKILVLGVHGPKRIVVFLADS